MIFIVYLDYLFSFNIFHFTSDGYYTELRDSNGSANRLRDGFDHFLLLPLHILHLDVYEFSWSETLLPQFPARASEGLACQKR